MAALSGDGDIGLNGSASCGADRQILNIAHATIA